MPCVHVRSYSRQTWRKYSCGILAWEVTNSKDSSWLLYVPLLRQLNWVKVRKAYPKGRSDAIDVRFKSSMGQICLDGLGASWFEVVSDSSTKNIFLFAGWMHLRVGQSLILWWPASHGYHFESTFPIILSDLFQMGYEIAGCMMIDIYMSTAVPSNANVRSC